MQPKYKIGQKVRVRSDLTYEQQYIDSRTGTSAIATLFMVTLAGQVVTIKNYTLNSNQYCIAEGIYNWVDTMFETIKEIPEGFTELSEGCYKSFNIPRKNKAPRKIHAPDPELLKYQRDKLKDLEAIFLTQEAALKIPNIMHGFIPNRNCVTVARKHIGFEATLMMDIVAFFDSVTPYHTEIKDPNLYTVEDYCGQGFATSPMLANIGILGIVKSIDDYLKELYYDQYAFTIYADDIQISINPNSSQPIYEEINEIIEIVSTAFEYFGFKIHPHKTRIRYAKHGYRRILGINVGNDHIRATRKTMKRIRAAKHSGNIPSFAGLTTWSRCYLPRKLRPLSVT
jgi:hypothetical protein